MLRRLSLRENGNTTRAGIGCEVEEIVTQGKEIVIVAQAARCW